MHNKSFIFIVYIVCIYYINNKDYFLSLYIVLTKYYIKRMKVSEIA